MSQLIYSVQVENSNGYTIYKLYIGEYDLNDTAKRLAGCEGNKDGYGTLDAAEKMARTFKALLDDGFTEYYDWGYKHNWMTARYQVYSVEDGVRTYCQPSFDFSNRFKGAEWGLALTKRIGKLIESKRAREYSKKHDFKVKADPVDDDTFRSLEDLTAALDKLGAIRCDRWKAPSSTGWAFPPDYYVAKKAA